MIEITKYSISALIAIMAVVDWISDKMDSINSRFNEEEDIPEFLKEDYKVFQISGRPRNDS